MKTPWWFLHKTPLAFLLLPFSLVYYMASRFVFMLRRARAYKSRRPIVCFGGILAGGVGKTPLVRVVAKYLNAPVVMRGYKKSAKTGNIGDEATMLMNNGITVHVGNRKSNVLLLNRQSDNTPIVMDDGMQNPSIVKDISIFVMDESLGYGNGFLLPAGPLREPKGHVSRADAIIVIRAKKRRKNFSLPVGMPIFYAENKTVSPYKKGERLVAFAGIGYPKKFFNSLTGVVAKKCFPDHYQYTDKDIEKLIAKAERKKAKLITTEKDWVRLPENMREKIKFASLETIINAKFFDWLKEKLDANTEKES
jgi:tetraacyldisaccharide 4'-kinase